MTSQLISETGTVYEFANMSATIKSAEHPTYPIPSGASFSMRTYKGRSQLILLISREDTWRNIHCFGYISCIKRDRSQFNTRSPFTMQVVTKLSFWDTENEEHAHLFVRLTAHSSHFAVGDAVTFPDQYSILRIGDPVSGVLRPTQSAEATLSLTGWKVVTNVEWQTRSPYTYLKPEEWCCDPQTTFLLPQLGSINFRTSPNPDNVSTAQLFPPCWDDNNLRTLAEETGNVQGIWGHNRSVLVTDPFHTPSGSRAGRSYRSQPFTISEDRQTIQSQLDEDLESFLSEGGHVQWDAESTVTSVSRVPSYSPMVPLGGFSPETNIDSADIDPLMPTIPPEVPAHVDPADLTNVQQLRGRPSQERGGHS